MDYPIFPVRNPDPDSNSFRTAEELAATKAGKNGAHKPGRDASPPLIEAWKPSQFLHWDEPKDYVLAGDGHLVRGGISVLGGAPGTGKSRASVALAIAGATGESWFNVPIRNRFRTLIVQMENGPYRLRNELSDIALPEQVNLDDWLRITPPPSQGLDFSQAKFRQQLRQIVDAFEPGLVVIDPWNQAFKGDGVQSEYRETLDLIQSTLPREPERRPALLIVHHLRKRTNNAGQSRKHGRLLLDELAGSYAIGAAARTVWVMEPGSAEAEDDRVVLTNCKCNDGPMLPRTAWHRRNGLFAVCETFDFDGFQQVSRGGEGTKHDLLEERLDTILQGFMGSRGDAADMIVQEMGKGRSTAYRYLDQVAHRFEEDALGNLVWVSREEDA